MPASKGIGFATCSPWERQPVSSHSSTHRPLFDTCVSRATLDPHECHLKPLLGHLAVNKLTTIDIDDLFRHLLRAGGNDGEPLAPGTVHRVHVVVHRALTQAVRWEWVWLNPAGAASPPRVAPAEVRPPSPDQVRRLLTHVEECDPGFAAYLWLAASTGARRSQLLGLRWTEIDVGHAALGFPVHGWKEQPARRCAPRRHIAAIGRRSTHGTVDPIEWLGVTIDSGLTCSGSQLASTKQIG
jgi:integrase